MDRNNERWSQKIIYIAYYSVGLGVRKLNPFYVIDISKY